MSRKMNEIIKCLAGTVVKLEKSADRRIARKNARKLMKLQVGTLLRAMDKQYPAIAKPKPSRATVAPVAGESRLGSAPSPAKPPKGPWRLKLPVWRSFTPENYKLFIAVALDGTALTAPIVLHYADSSLKVRPDRPDLIRGNSISVSSSWTAAQKWEQVIAGIALLMEPNDRTERMRTENRLVDLWCRFWSDPIPLADLVLTAKHQAFIEKRAKAAERMAKLTNKER